jgi:hypothetical protein
MAFLQGAACGRYDPDIHITGALPCISSKMRQGEDGAVDHRSSW